MSMTSDEMIAVIRKRKDGTAIERRLTENGLALSLLLGRHSDELDGIQISCELCADEAFIWRDLMAGDPFNFSHWEYRIKPSPPKPREGWVRLTVMHAARPPCCECNDYIHVREVLPSQEAQP